MKSYLLFYYRGYYPSGAFNDYIDSFDTKEAVLHYIQSLPKSLQEQVVKGTIEFQILNANTMHVLTIDDIDLVEDITNDQKYTPLKNQTDFDDLIEDCTLEDELDTH